MRKLLVLAALSGLTLAGAATAFAEDAATAPSAPVAETPMPRGGEKAQKMFEKLDENKDGAISSEESEKWGKTRFETLDTDKDGKVSKAEMEAGRPEPRGEGRNPERIDRRAKWREERFEALDADKDGALSIEEFEARHKKAQAEADADKDGKVTREEFDARKSDMREKMKEMREKRMRGKEKMSPPDSAGSGAQ